MGCQEEQNECFNLSAKNLRNKKAEKECLVRNTRKLLDEKHCHTEISRYKKYKKDSVLVMKHCIFKGLVQL